MFVKKSTIITTEFERFGGDHTDVLSLVLTNDGTCWLWYGTDKPLVQSITRQPEYIQWLFNTAKIMDLSNPDPLKKYWFNDKPEPDDRFNEWMYYLDNIYSYRY